MERNNRPLILITNDDGFRAKGIRELIKALKDLGELVVMAPDGPRSGMSSAITSLVPIKYKVEWEEPGVTVYSCTGTPVDCVKLAINEVLDREPDLLVSGINQVETWLSASTIPVRWELLPKAVSSGFLPWAFPYWITGLMRISRNVAGWAD